MASGMHGHICLLLALGASVAGATWEDFTLEILKQHAEHVRPGPQHALA